MTRRVLVALAVLSLPLSACVDPNLKDAQTLARSGDWESALERYRQAHDAHPDDVAVVHQMDIATAKVISIYTKRGDDANKAGRLGEASGWWKKALDLCDPVVAPKEKSDAFRRIDSNEAALEYYGDVAAAQQRWEDAADVYGAILEVHPERTDLAQKNGDAQRAFAEALEGQADALAKANLLGAALVEDLRALQHDPLQPKAFSAGNDLRKTLRSRSKVSLQDVKVDDHGYHGLGLSVGRVLTPHLDDVQPYGPTKDPEAIRASFKVTILDFKKEETTTNGVDDLPNDEQPSTVPIANPAIPEQQKKIADLNDKLASLQQQLKAQVATAAKSHRPADFAPKGELPEDAKDGLPIARQVDQTRADLAQAKAELAQLPAKVPPPPPSPTWQMPWSETTRTVTATLRFEIDEPDYAQPIVLELTHRSSKTDRTHAAFAKHHVEADTLQLPSYEDLTEDLAAQFADGVKAIDQAKDRRVADKLDDGRKQLAAGHQDEALEDFVQVLFIAGPQGLPEDAAAFVARKMEHDRFKEVVAAN